MFPANSIGDPLYGRPAQPTGRPSGSSRNLAVPEDPRAFAANDLNRSLNPINNTFLQDNSWRGDGANVISDRLNFGGRRVIEGQPQIQYVPREVVREVYEDEYLPAIAPAPIIDDQINANARNILAEAMARVALLLMENNRLKMIEARKLSEIQAFGFRPPMVQQQPIIQTIAAPRPPVVTQQIQQIQTQPAIPLVATQRVSQTVLQRPAVQTIQQLPRASYTVSRSPVMTTTPVVAQPISRPAIPVIGTTTAIQQPVIRSSYTTLSAAPVVGQTIQRPAIPVVGTTTAIQQPAIRSSYTTLSAAPIVG